MKALLSLLLFSPFIAAHHSDADYNRAQQQELRGTLTAIHWANPHIILSMNSGEALVRIEWITVTGAVKTGVSSQQFAVGDEIVVRASPHRNPAMHSMSLVQSLQLPGKDWVWTSPELTNTPLLTP